MGLHQGCVILPWLFNLFMDGLVKEENERILERGGGTWELS